MKYLRIFEEFNPTPQNIFYRFSYLHKGCGKGMIWNPDSNSCQSKISFFIYPNHLTSVLLCVL
jgi:hypothetical protein